MTSFYSLTPQVTMGIGSSIPLGESIPLGIRPIMTPEGYSNAKRQVGH